MSHPMFMPEPEFDRGIIIDRPTLLSKTRNLTEWSVSIMSWILWFYALRPVWLAGMWVMGYEQLYHHMIALGGMHNWQYVETGFYLTGVIFLVMVLWNRYNTIKYRYHYKGAGPELATEDVMATYYHMPVEDIRIFRKQARVDAYFEEDHRLRLRSGDFQTEGYYNPQQQEVERIEVL